MKFLSDILIKAGLIVDGTATFNSVANASIDTDKFLVSDSGVLKYRTGAQVLSDIGAQAQLTINNNSDYRVLTGSSTANTLNAQSKLQFYDNIGALYIEGVASFGYGGGVEFVNVAVNGTQWGLYGGSTSDTGLMLYRYLPTQYELAYWNTDRYALRNDVKMAWSSTNLSFGTPDLALQREAAGVLQVNNGTTGQYASVKVNGVTASALSGTGTRMVVADSSGVLSTQSITTGTVTSIDITAGSGISVSGGPITSSGSITVTNAAPDQVVSLTGAGTTSISGTYPNFTITSADQYVGTVTSVNASVPTGFTIGGNPVTSSGTLAIGFASGYSLPTDAKQTDWDTAYTNRITSLTTSGNSGAATLSSNTLNIPNYTLSGLGGEPAITAGTSAQYWRGDKTFQTLDTLAVAENTNLYFTADRVRNTLLTGLNLTGGGTIASTDSVLQAFGKVQNQISALVGGVMYQGTWNASTNTPTLTSSVGTKGYYYIVTTAGSTNLNGITDWKIGDWAIFNGSTWDKVDNTDAVSSVNGYTGAVSLVTDDIPEAGSPVNLYFTQARARTSVSLTTSGSSGASTYDNTTGVFNVPTYTLSGLGGVPSTRTLTINGTGYDLSADRIWSVGTVTSVGALTIGTTGTDITSTVANGTTTPVITLNIPTASATNRGALSSTDWSTFNGKQAQLNGTGFVKASGTTITYDNSTYYLASNPNSYIALTALSASAPLSYNSGTGAFSISQASGSTNGYLSSTDWTTFNNKQNALTNPVTGTGTSGFHVKWTGTGTVGNSIIDDDGFGASVALGTGGAFNIKASGSIRLAMSGTSTHGIINTPVDVGLKFQTDSVDRLTIAATGAATFSSSVTASSFVKSGGTASQYLMADGTTSTLTNPVTGTGTTNYIPKFTSSSAIGNSVIYESGGSIGIGATTLGGKFQVKIDTDLNIAFNSTGGISRISAFNDAISASIPLIINADDLRFSTGGSERLRISSTGNVGIGTMSPSWKLDVRGTGMFNGDLQLDIGELNIPKTLYFNANSTTGGSYGNIKWYNVQWDGNTRGEIVVEGDGALANGRMIFKTGSSGSNATERMRITSGGNVLIGTTTDDGSSRLQVNGTIKTAAPTGGTAKPWKLGKVYTGACGVPSGYNSFKNLLTDTYIEIEVDGTLYYVPIFNTGWC